MNERIIYTRTLKWNLVKFAVRIAVFMTVFLVYLTHKQLLIDLMTRRFFVGIAYTGINALHVLWFCFMLMMLRHLFPKKVLTMAIRKGEPDTFVEQPGYAELSLLRFMQTQNVRAWVVLLVWLIGNSLFALLYLFGVITCADLLMLTVFYFLCDYICIMLFCPFQTFIMKNRCCVNCRIYEWGHFMMFTPMLFIKNFFSWSLFFTSLVVLIKWEISCAKHPERFWSGSNQSIQCANCKDKTCQIKKKIRNNLVGEPSLEHE